MSKQPFDAARLFEFLKKVHGYSLPDRTMAESIKLEPKKHRAFLKAVRHSVEYLSKLEGMIEEIDSPSFVFNLNNPVTLGEVVSHKLEQLPPVTLASIRKFYGSGVYSFYYSGAYPAYRAISGTMCPIYVGSAGPRLNNADNPRLQGVKLFGRINEHLTRSIAKSRNLQTTEFTCRYLVVQSGLEKAAEDFLIKMYLPVWNKEAKVCSGIGKHGDKARQELSDWDILHGGRLWAEGQRSLSGMTVEKIHANIDAHFRKQYAQDPNRWKKVFNRDWWKQLQE